MNITDRIKKRIDTWRMISKDNIDKVFINEKEAEELGDIREIEGVKLVVQKKQKVKEDCFAYNGQFEDCNVMSELICKEKRCKRYSNVITQKEIDKSIKDYAIRRSK